ncbi:MAG: hypothetical protein HYY18_02425 [Planctomycetes bacterium]|nr:hypothetical protein [Planctomycetota bacterium]
MLEGLRPSRNDLTSRFALSQRLAVRIGALMSSKLELTAAVLESAKPGSAVETLLLRKETLSEARDLDTARLVQLGTGLPLDLDLVVEEQEGKRVIGLAEEQAAAAEFTAPAAAAVAPLALSPVDVDPLAALMPRMAVEAAGLFSTEDVNRLKLALLTGVDPKTKVEALRKLMYAPLPQNEKGLLFLRAVSDESPEVRAEAAAGLRGLGLDPATAAAVRALSEGSAPERTAAINALARRATDAGDAERAVVIAALAADLRGAPDPPRAAQILRALAGLSPHLARNSDFAAAVLRIAVRRLYAGAGEVSDAVGDFFAAYGAVDPAGLASLLWSELDAAPDRRSRSQLLLALARIAPAAGPGKLAKKTALLIADWNDSDFDCRRAGNALLGLGEIAVDAILETLPNAASPQRPFLIRLCDQVCERPGTPDTALEKFAKAMAELLKTARRPVRIAVLDSRCLGPRVSAETRREIALQIVNSAHDFNLEEVVPLSEAFLRRLGVPGVRELAKAIKSSPHQVEREIALRSLDAILTDNPTSTKEAGDALRLCLDLLKAGKFPNEPLLAVTTGRIAALSGAPSAAVRGTTMELRNLLRSRPGRFEILEAYSWCVSSPHVEADQKMSAGLTLLGLLDSKMPEDFVKEAWTNDGLQLTIGKTSSAHTVLIPTLIGGLVRVALSGAGTDLFLEKITHGLLNNWKRVVNYEMVWSPGNVSDLGTGLGKIASRRETPLHLRLDVIDALRARTVHVPVAKALGEALSLEETSKRMDGLCAAVTKELCELAVHRDFQDPEDRGALLGSLAKIALRQKLAPDADTGEDLRRRIAGLLFDALRDGVAGSREALQKMVDAAAVPKAQKKGIQERLGRN